MFDSTLELITQVASNSLFIFCFCNLIIVIILMGSKPSPNNDQESEVRISSVDNTYSDKKQETVAKHLALGGNKRLIDVAAPSNAREAPAGSNKENAHDDENDEFRRRVEEFIYKVNRGWKAESLRTSCLV
ncbi:hypothetical protein P3X46_023704 [Hevea brasiliensis]|uniref:DUF4408 domain-containing protein n=1 Tax=Hevea brasiliensis TaxID=3981 RepID=A0ABQ9LCX5_HEVBR|nr:uncharacterized protein LOC131171968 [Hevea brasiliensis]KAJ9164089.1 hypothetical protein P3X46_023704 [Hevea brasiliensis]